MQNAIGVTFVMKEMVKHLANLLFVNALFIFLVRKRTKSGAEYDIKLIGQPTNYFKSSAAVIGISFAVIAILIVIVFNQNVMVVIAAVFISFGTGRQIFASALIHGNARKILIAREILSKTTSHRHYHHASPLIRLVDIPYI